jgi:hypothetical protein
MNDPGAGICRAKLEAIQLRMGGTPMPLVPVAIAAAATTATAVTTTATAVTTATTATVATAASATTTAITTAAAPTTTGAVFLGTGFIDGQGTAIVLLSVQGGDRGLGFGVAGHFHESKALAATCVAIVDDLSRHHLTMCAEELFEFRAVDGITEIPHVQLLAHYDLLR